MKLRARRTIIAVAVLAVVMVVVAASELRTTRRAGRELQNLSWGIPVAYAGSGRDCLVFEVGKPDYSCGIRARTAAPGAKQILESAVKSISNSGKVDSAKTLATVDLWYWRENAGALTRAVTNLRELSETHPEVAENWSNLSGALLLKYAASSDARSLLEALHCAHEALRRDARSPDALWNRAVAVTWLGLRESQQVAWNDYTTLTGKTAPSVRLGQDVLRMPVRDAAMSAQWIENSRAYLWSTLLPKWGHAVLAADTLAEGAAMGEIESIASASKDSDVFDSPRSLRDVIAEPKPAARRLELARGFVEFGEYKKHFADSDWSRARKALIASERELAFKKVFAQRIAVENANVLMVDKQPDSARRILVKLLPAARKNAPALARRAEWGIALTYQSAGQHSVTVALLDTLRNKCAAFSEEDCSVGAGAFAGASQLLLGNTDEAMSILVQAMQYSAHVPLTSRRWSALYQLNLAVTREFGGDEAGDFAYEFSEVSDHLGRVASAVLSARQRAELLLRQHDVAGARAAAEHLDNVWMKASPAQQEEYRADVLWINGELARQEKNSRSSLLLDSAMRVAERSKNRERMMMVAYSRAQAMSDRGDSVGAVNAIDSMLTTFRARAGDSASIFEKERINELGRTATVFAAQLLLARSMAAQALNALSGRSFQRQLIVPTDSEQHVAIREVGDSLVAWTITNGQIAARALPMRVVQLRRLATRTDSAAAVELFDALVNPWLNASPDNARSIVKLDLRGLPSAVAWSALRDRRSGRFLIEQREIQLVSNAFARDIAQKTTMSARRVAIIDAAPRIGARRLAGASAEVASLKALWQGNAIVVSAANGAPAVRRSMETATIVHFAGHAQLNGMEPGKSALFIPSGGADSLLSAAELEKWRLPAVSLVVLAACDTRVAGRTPLSGLESLAGVFHEIGVREVIGAGWPVDDDATKDFMTALHDGIQRGFTSSSALRRAQLQLLHSADPNRNSPAVWAAFQLLGR